MLERDLRRFGKLIPMFFHVVSVTERYEAFQKNRFDLQWDPLLKGAASSMQRTDRRVYIRNGERGVLTMLQYLKYWS